MKWNTETLIHYSAETYTQSLLKLNVVILPVCWCLYALDSLHSFKTFCNHIFHNRIWCLVRDIMNYNYLAANIMENYMSFSKAPHQWRNQFWK